FFRNMRTSSQKLRRAWGHRGRGPPYGNRLGCTRAYFSEGFPCRLRLYWPTGRTPGGTRTMHRQTGRRPALLAALLTAGWAAAQGGGPTDKGDPNKQLALALVDGSVRGVAVVARAVPQA